MLEERKNVQSRNELTNLANSYGIDEPVLDGLVRTINTPSIAEETRRMVTNEAGEERMTVMVRRVNTSTSFC